MNLHIKSMLKQHASTLVVMLTALITCLSSSQAWADDTEIFYGSTATASSPNIMLILDTSGSMVSNSITTTAAYKPSTTYSGSCSSDYIYYSTSTSKPSCSGTNYIDADEFYCSPATESGGAFATAGYYSDYAVRWTQVDTSSSVTVTPQTTTTVVSATTIYNSDKSKSRNYSSSSSSSTSTGSGSTSSTASTTYTWQAAMSKASSSSSSTTTVTNSTSSSTSSTSGTLSPSVKYGSTTYVSYTTVTTTTVKNETATTTTNSTSYNLTDVACKTNELSAGTPSTTGYPNGVSPSSTAEWIAASASSYWSQGGTQTNYYFYTANYLNYYYDASTTTTQTRLEVMQDAIAELLNTSSGVNVGLMRYDAKGNGGMVTDAVDSIDTVKDTIISEVDSWEGEGNTPLTETLYEAYLYFAGKDVYFGNGSYTARSSSSSGCSLSSSGGGGGGGGSSTYYCSKPSVAASRVSSSSSASAYNSPADYACQKNYVVFLTDGEPRSDTSADSLISAMLTANSSSSASSCSSADSSNGGGCLKALTNYMYNNDLRSDVDETQNVTTYFIGLGSDFSGSSSSSNSAFSYLEAAANAGGGEAYSAGDLTELSEVFTDIFDSIKTDSSTFTSPSVAVNAFNQTQVLEDVYFSVFQPSSSTHWPGNVKKYKINSDGIVDANYDVAVDSSTGFFKSSAQDFWSTSTTNNNKVTVGGAANLIPDPDERTVYTYIGSNPGSSSSYKASMQDFDTSNTSITASLLDVSSSSRDTIIDWARGEDVNDDDGDDSTTDARHVMGDPIHSQPQVVIYGNDSSATTTTAKLNDAVVYVATNDGYLHAIDVSSGVELWSFIPQEALSHLVTLYNDEAGDTKQYILDGNLRVLKFDVDGDGVVDTADGDRVILYFSQGRGGSTYYALDITYKNVPKFMWSIGSGTLPDIGESWSTPAIGRVNISGASQNTQKLVLIFGGGYSDDEEDVSYIATDSVGRAIYMVDAVHGDLLWSGGYTGTGATQSFAGMDHAIPSDITIADTNSDGYTDRMYVGDMAGQLWRFDITNGNAASSLVAGGVIASLGTHDDTTHTNASNRRFYNAPDIATFSSKGGTPYYNISIGSGYRGHPLNTTTEDRFYAIRDYNPYTALSQSSYNDYPTVTDSDLTDITSDVYNNTTPTIPSATSGWKLIFDTTGEKQLSNSTTVSGTVLFNSYIPSSSTVNCNPASGTSHSYAINVATGTNKFDYAYESSTVAGLPATTLVVDTSTLVSTTESDSDSSGSSGSDGSSGSESSDTSTDTGTICIKGASVATDCVDAPSPVKTLWKESGAN